MRVPLRPWYGVCYVAHKGGCEMDRAKTTLDLGALIREARERAGVRAADLARALGKQQNEVWRWESGRREPTIALLETIADALGMELEIRFRRRRARPAGDAPADPSEPPAPPAGAQAFPLADYDG